MEYETAPLIDDDTIFGAHAWAADELTPITPTELSPLVKEVKPRHEFAMLRANPGYDPAAVADQNKYLDDPVYVTLRIDAELAMISGDIFWDIRRVDWRLSFTSEVIFSAPEGRKVKWGGKGWDLLAIAEVHWPEEPLEKETTFRKVTVALRLENGEISSFRIIGLQPKTGEIFDHVLIDAPIKCFDSFRYMKLNAVFHTAKGDDPIYEKIARQALGTHGKHLLADLQGAGPRIGWDLTEDDFRCKTPDGCENAGEYEMLVRTQWSRDPYRYSLLLTSLTHGEGISGRVPGLDGERPATKPRAGAIVYVKQIVENQIARCGAISGMGCAPGTPVSDLFETDGTPKGTPTKVVRYIYERIRLFFIHELGHQMNLPHPWQRGRFDDPALMGNPAAHTVMNYGSFYPLGVLMDVSRKRNFSLPGDQKTARQKDADRSLEGALKELRFSDNEVRWIRHCPFDRFAPNGRVFTHLREAPRLRPETPGRGAFLLEIWDAEVENDTHFLRVDQDDRKKKQPLFGEVILKLTPSLFDRYLVPFSFRTPSLSLLIKTEYPDLDGRDTVRIVQSPHIPIAGNTELEPFGFVPEEDPEGYKVFRCKLPLLQGEFFDLEDDRGGRKIHRIQAVLQMLPRDIEADEKERVTFRSNVTKVEFRKSKHVTSNILRDPDLPILVEAASRLSDGGDLSSLEFPRRHDFGKERRLEALCRDIAGLQSEPVSTKLFEFLKEKVTQRNTLKSWVDRLGPCPLVGSR